MHPISVVILQILNLSHPSGMALLLIYGFRTKFYCLLFFFAFWSFGKCALTIFPYLFLVSFLAAEKKRRAEEAQQSGPNASTQSNGTVSLLLLYKPYFLYLLLYCLIRLVLVLVQQLCDCTAEFCLSYQTTSLSLPYVSWWCF